MITFTVHGKPQGKGRPRFAKRGKYTVAYTPEVTASYENLIKLIAAETMRGRALMTGAVSIEILANFSPPRSWSFKKKTQAVRGEIFPTVKPDVDNILKVVADALNGIVWRDDVLAVDGIIRKRYDEWEGLVVTIRELNANGQLFV